MGPIETPTEVLLKFTGETNFEMIIPDGAPISLQSSTLLLVGSYRESFQTVHTRSMHSSPIYLIDCIHLHKEGLFWVHG